jgi:hypothetical protein
VLAVAIGLGASPRPSANGVSGHKSRKKAVPIA